MASNGGTRAAAPPSTTSTSRPPPSPLDISSDESLHMSRASDAASRLGKLSISGSSSRRREDMPVITRRQRQQQQESAAPSSSRAAASSSGTSGQQSQATRIQPPRQVREQRYPPGRQQEDSEDSEPNEEHYEQDNDQDSDDGVGNAETLRRLYQDTIIQTMALFDRNQLSGPELWVHPNHLPETSRPYRDLIQVLLGCDAARIASGLNGQFPVHGEFFADRLFHNYRDRFTRNRDAFDNGTHQDAIATLKAFRTIYGGIRGVFIENRLMGNQERPGIRNDCKSNLILLLFQILHAIVERAQDVRPRTAQVFAGGAHQFEHNLWLRFSTYPDEWTGFVNVLDALQRLPQAVNFFRDHIRQLRTTIQALHQRYPGWANLYNQSQYDLISRLRELAGV